MSNFKEFQSKNIDQAIQDACAFFGTEREKLEIEIVEDAKMGVFGIIGARKAKIRARLASLSDFNMPGDEGKKQKPYNRKKRNIRNPEPKNRFLPKTRKRAKAKNVSLPKFRRKTPLMVKKSLMNTSLKLWTGKPCKRRICSAT